MKKRKFELNEAPLFFFYRNACVIEIEEAMIITGGDAHGGYIADTTRVVQYDIHGNKTYLPSLNSKRSDHACGSFMNSENKRVGKTQHYTPV